ncbi:hypothetical protein [Pseudonocardia sp. D17]|uniref:hypothetical protein n=1 Tax=Pseudonocardia sp. D17 TaxID=882661 RepID=UPI0030CDAF3D
MTPEDDVICSATEPADPQSRVHLEPTPLATECTRAAAGVAGAVVGAPARAEPVFERLGRGATTGILITAAAGIPSDVVPNPIFTRMTPVRWWDYALIIGAVLLGVVWSTAAPGARRRQAYRWSTFITALTLLAVGCPSCNKAAVALLGDVGALSTWGSIQPVVGVTTLVIAGAALVWLSTPRRALRGEGA